MIDWLIEWCLKPHWHYFFHLLKGNVTGFLLGSNENTGNLLWVRFTANLLIIKVKMMKIHDENPVTITNIFILKHKIFHCMYLIDVQLII